jgi:hypothetical protein
MPYTMRKRAWCSTKRRLHREDMNQPMRTRPTTRENVIVASALLLAACRDAGVEAARRYEREACACASWTCWEQALGRFGGEGGEPPEPGYFSRNAYSRAVFTGDACEERLRTDCPADGGCPVGTHERSILNKCRCIK